MRSETYLHAAAQRLAVALCILRNVCHRQPGDLQEVLDLLRSAYQDAAFATLELEAEAVSSRASGPC